MVAEHTVELPALDERYKYLNDSSLTFKNITMFFIYRNTGRRATGFVGSGALLKCHAYQIFLSLNLTNSGRTVHSLGDHGISLLLPITKWRLIISICKQMSNDWIANVINLQRNTPILWYFTHCGRERVHHRGSAWRSHSRNVHVGPGRPVCGWRRETCACQVRIFEQWLHPRCRSTGYHNRGRKCHPWDSSLGTEKWSGHTFGPFY